MSASVISATQDRGKQNNYESHRQPLGKRMTHYCTVPRGRPGISDSAHSTAATVSTRKLSDAAQIQNPLSRAVSGRTATCIFSWPAALTLLGESSAPRDIST